MYRPRGAGGLKKASIALCHQATTLDRAKLAELMGTLTPDLLSQIEDGLKAAMNLQWAGTGTGRQKFSFPPSGGQGGVQTVAEQELYGRHDTPLAPLKGGIDWATGTALVPRCTSGPITASCATPRCPGSSTATVKR
ncbi:MAG: type II toxin-antitoxin system PemK/MazF family toxin [Syntrophobacteraceae bacterium]